MRSIIIVLILLFATSVGAECSETGLTDTQKSEIEQLQTELNNLYNCQKDALEHPTSFDSVSKFGRYLNWSDRKIIETKAKIRAIRRSTWEYCEECERLKKEFEGEQ